MSDINGVRERLERACIDEHGITWLKAGDLRALLDDHARLQAEVARQKSAVQAIAPIIPARPQPPAGVDEAAAIRAFEEHYGSADDPCVEGGLELWLAAWRAAAPTTPAATAAPSDEHATRNPQLTTQEPVACAFFTEKGYVDFTSIYDRTLKALERVKKTRMGISSGSIDLYAAPLQQLTAPPGWKLVPVEPTPEMVEAYHSVEAVTACSDDDADDQWAIESYRAMLAAAPEVK